VNGNFFSLIGIVITLIVAIFAANWAVINLHSNAPHKDAVSVREFTSIESRLDRLEEKIDRLLIKDA
jgi:hypothetical protein